MHQRDLNEQKTNKKTKTWSPTWNVMDEQSWHIGFRVKLTTLVNSTSCQVDQTLKHLPHKIQS